MIEKRNAYEIVGTNKIAVDRIKEESEKDMFIHEKASGKINKLSSIKEMTEERKELSGSVTEKIEMQRKLRNLQKEIELVKKAFQKIADRERRDRYNAYLEMLDKTRENEYRIIEEDRLTQNQAIKHRTAYEILETSQKECDDTRKTTENINKELVKARDGLIEIAKANYEESIKGKGKNLFAAQQKRDLEIGIVQEAYEKIATRRKREIYNEELKEKEEQEQKEIEQKQSERIYNKRKMYDPTSIRKLQYKDMTKDNGETNLLGVTMVKENGQKLLLQQVGKIEYEDSFGLQGEVGEYEITRVVGSRVKTDKVYITGLDMSDLSIEENTGNLKDEAYYQFITNEMLSEESTEQCLKYNNGYLGEILYDENNGKYFRFLDGREELSAVMKYYEEKNNGQESLVENEGVAYE